MDSSTVLIDQQYTDPCASGPIQETSTITYSFTFGGDTNEFSIERDISQSVDCDSGATTTSPVTTTTNNAGSTDQPYPWALTFGCSSSTEFIPGYLGTETANWDGNITFQCPWYYSPNTPVIFTFFNVGYTTAGAVDLSQVTFQGNAPIAWDNTNDTVSYLLSMSPGDGVTIGSGSFAWPAGYSSVTIDDPESPFPYETADDNVFSFDGFGNAVVTVGVNGPQNLYVFCSIPDPQYPFTASTSPFLGGTFSWYSYPNGAIAFSPSTPPTPENSGVFGQAVDPSHASQPPGNDIRVAARFYPTGASSYAVTNMSVTVRKPWGFSRSAPQYIDPPESNYVFEAIVTYTVMDQFCQPIPSEYLSGVTANETVLISCWNNSGNPVLSGNTFYDKIGRVADCTEPPTTQTITVDCATLTQTLDVNAGGGTLTYTVTGGNLCQ